MKKRNKYGHISMLAMLSAVVALTACSDKGAAPSANGEAAANKKEDITASIYDWGTLDPAEGSIDNNRWTQYVNEHGPANVKFIPVPRTDSVNKFNLLYASGEAPDLVNEFSQPFVNTLLLQKQLMPLNDLVENHSVEYKKFLEDNPVIRKLATKDDGQMYQFGRFNLMLGSTGTNGQIYIRTDWLKKLNLELPATTEELYTVAKAFAQQDPEGKGQKTYGINMGKYGDDVINTMFGINSSLLNMVVKDDKLTVFWDNMRDALAFKKRLFDEGIVDKDYITDKTGSKALQDFLTGKLGILIYESRAPGVIDTIKDPLLKNNPNATMTLIPYPKSSYGQFVRTTNPVQLSSFISSSAKHPEAVMKYVDFLIKPETVQTMTNGMEGVHYKVNSLGCFQEIDLAKNKKEVAYSNDLRYLTSPGLDFNKCNLPAAVKYDDPRKAEYVDMFDLYVQTYNKADYQYPGVTHSEQLPALPSNLQTAYNSMQQQIGMNTTNGDGELWVKAIMSGASYTPDQAITDAKNVYYKAGGQEIDDFMNDWYSKKKDNYVMGKDIMGIMKSQVENYEKVKTEIN